MKSRIISGLIGLALLITIVMNGGIIFDLSVLLLSLVGVYEFNKAIRKIENINPISWINYALAIGLFLLNFTKNNILGFILFLYLIISLCLLVLKSEYNVKDISITIFGGLYVPFFFYHMYLLNDNVYIWLVFIGAFATDTFAYFTGMTLGKKKLCPEISPKKTVEGSIGGIIGTLVVMIIFSRKIGIDNIIGISILSIILSIMAQMGDLTASTIKRSSGIKDYGNLMPGHGGVLDRFDSILFVTPIVYYYITYML
ncbi:phosphatidate cytidylyltransferase CdsA [Gottschalkia acidurici 9a]|uniref:Phosphatidate cytidylyltransferase n=1 Tax=Gottschalkia acidurici (strain ATCC 7906 / DSM 604 / BCRC 14475 / CIP 104303 / KCTC 5404 / NCIMB 10678 / 9a) TaxID=1128398 RepID=K0AZ76_GOTA9|nr:phosphatidate cytidylyltransferase [Gottschalkia acidurici]AFS78574.1 phosphatidate cytidylyltransferase CdsA [Gottschalkia acidurici 9a]